MATTDNVLRRLKDSPGDLSLVVLKDGQYYDTVVNNIRSVYVKPEKDWEGNHCYGIADEEDPDSFQVLAIE